MAVDISSRLVFIFATDSVTGKKCRFPDRGRENPRLSGIFRFFGLLLLHWLEQEQVEVDYTCCIEDVPRKL